MPRTCMDGYRLLSRGEASCPGEAEYQSQLTEQPHVLKAEGGALSNLLMWSTRPNHRAYTPTAPPWPGSKPRCEADQHAGDNQSLWLQSSWRGPPPSPPEQNWQCSGICQEQEDCNTEYSFFVWPGYWGKKKNQKNQIISSGSFERKSCCLGGVMSLALECNFW